MVILFVLIVGGFIIYTANKSFDSESSSDINSVSIGVNESASSSAEIIKVGESLGEFKVASIKPYEENTAYSERFPFGPDNYSMSLSGEIVLSGRYVYYGGENIKDPKLDFIYFQPDESSRLKLPRPQGRERRQLYFRNNDLAKKLFGSDRKTGEATVIVANYIINEFPTETADSAELIDVIDIK